MASLIVLFAATAPTPPVIPEVQVVSSNEQIILMWDNKAESSIDSLTGYSDFEGYRIYRSNDGGQTWGKSWNRIYDYLGNHVAWKPFAQFDLIEESDPWVCVGSYKYEIVGKLRELDKKSNYYHDIQKKIEDMENAGFRFQDFEDYCDDDDYEEKDDPNRLSFKQLLNDAGVATIDDLFFD